MTIDLFDKFFLDKVLAISPMTPHHPRSACESLVANPVARTGIQFDHAPAYLINLWLATGEKKYADMLEHL